MGLVSATLVGGVLEGHWILQVGLVVFSLGVALQLLSWLSRRAGSQAATPRGLRREAKRAASRGEHGIAGDRYRDAGDLVDAIEQYKLAGQYENAARCHVELGHHRHAAALFERARFFEDAAHQYELAGELKQAELNYGRAGRKFLAAKMYEDHGELSLAAHLYRDLKKHEKAASLFEDLGRPLDAAQLYAKVHAMRRSARHTRTQMRGELTELEEKVIALFEEAGDIDGLFEFLQAAGRYERAAELAIRLDRPDDAVELYTKANREDRAALVLETSGQVLRAARLRGDLALKNQELHSAARHYESAGEMRLAAQVHEQLGDYERAADAYEAGGDPGQAAYFYTRVGRFEKAADLYDQAGNVDAAVRCLETTGQLQRCAELLDRAGRSFEAGRKFLQLASFDDAIKSLQQVPAASPSKRAAQALLGIAFFEKGEMRLARAKLEEAIEKGGVGARAAPSAEVHYYLGRVYEDAGELTRARDEYERVLALNFTYRDAGDRLTALQNPEETGVRPRSVGPSDTDGAGHVIIELGGSLDEASSRPRSTSDLRRPASPHEETRGAYADLLAANPSAQTEPPTHTNAGSSPYSFRGRIDEPPRIAMPSKRYKVLEELGRGGMGVVYKCHDTLLDRLVAYKVLGAQIRDFPAALDSFIREAKSAARLNHPNIVTLYDFGESEDGYFMTLEYVAGRNLRQFFRKERPDPEQMRGILIGICNGLKYAHSQSVVHRDVKPSNILISSIDLKAKILDFGLAKVIERSQQTASGVLGTPWYMSPEQVLGTTTDHRTDLYSLGVTLFEILTGELPFKGRDFGYHHVHTIPPRADEVNPCISAATTDIIARCLEKNPEDRFESAEDIRKMLHRIELFDDGLYDALQERERARAKAG